MIKLKWSYVYCLQGERCLEQALPKIIPEDSEVANTKKGSKFALMGTWHGKFMTFSKEH